MVFLNGVHFGHIQTEMLLIHISRTFLESLGIGKWPFFDDHDVIPFLSDFVFGELHSDSLYLRKSFISRPGIRATPVGTSENKKKYQAVRWSLMKTFNVNIPFLQVISSLLIQE